MGGPSGPMPFAQAGTKGIGPEGPPTTAGSARLEPTSGLKGPSLRSPPCPPPRSRRRPSPRPTGRCCSPPPPCC
ncbi:DUF6053 domain-containing protein [Lysobacter enzymogenes]|uniref:DUF6053 domain-containing protein n=1 Tax=Lysobacter enzymogenes TaxID=69 RepID=UPI003D18D15E